MRKAGRLTWKEGSRAIRQMERKRVGARDTDKRKRMHREAGADTEGCSVPGRAPVHSQSGVLVCPGPGV